MEHTSWAISIFVIGGAALLLIGTIVLAILIAVITKRPGIAAIVGLVPLLGIAVVFGSLLVWQSESHHRVHYDEPTLTSQFVEMPPHAGGISYDSRINFHPDLSMFKLLAVCAVAVAIAMAVASKGKHRNPGQARGHWWPVLLLLPLIVVVPGLFIVRSVGFRAEGPPQVALLEEMRQDTGNLFNHFKYGDERATAHVRAEFQRQRAQAQAEVARAQLRVAEQIRHHSDAAEAKRITEQASEEAMSALLRVQFANMDINQLIEMFQAPKIDLHPTTAEAEAPPVAALAVAASAPPEVNIVAAEAESDEKSTDAVPAEDSTDKTMEGESANSGSDAPAVVEKDAEGEKHDSDASNVENIDVEAQPGDLQRESSTPAAAAKPLPSWVNNQPGMVGPNWREVIVTDEYATEDECRQATDVFLLLKTADRAQSLGHVPFFESGRPSLTFDRGMVMLDDTIIYDRRNRTYWRDHRLQMLQKMGIGIDYLRRSITRDQHMASRESPRSMGTMYKQYTLVEFTPEFNSALQRAWNNYARQERFEIIGGWSAAVLGLLGLVFGLLKVDTWTKGYYSKRLFIGVPAAIIGGIILLLSLYA
jgi:hypothetical protein